MMTLIIGPTDYTLKETDDDGRNKFTADFMISLIDAD
jgi:hypothetical protein